MPKETKHRYAINFDLSIQQLELYYSKTNPKGAYKKISRYVERYTIFGVSFKKKMPSTESLMAFCDY